ncbi:MAG TPA: hypothetical protein VFX07_04435, partial [Candidatus Udaeobacter sp.]|nr:hypothetical protein [Candidatus Udaeobacter sp.]
MNNKFLSGAVSFIIALIAGNSSAQAVTGNGTTGTIPVWTGPTSQGNSIITQSAGKIGIGTAAPGGVLGVAATNGIGILSLSNTSIGVAGIGGGTAGVAGYSPTSYGVLGISVDGAAMYGTASGAGDGIDATANTGYGGYFSSATNDAADFFGNNWGIYVLNHGAQPAIQGIAYGNNYAGRFTSDVYRAGYFKSNNSGLYSLFVDSQGGPGQGTSALEVNGSMRAEGNLYIAGSKAGYVVDEMQNVDSVNLEAGDVVVIAEDSSAPVLGQIPVPRIKLAANANDTAVVGVVDQIMYVPDAATRAAYESQEKADRDAASRAQNDPGNKQESMANIPNRISDEAGTLHPDSYATSARPGAFCSVVTLGAYKAVKADASFGAIRAGDLLTTSSHAGYAMRVNDKAAASGAIIGKALSSLASGTGSVTV